MVALPRSPVTRAVLEPWGPVVIVALLHLFPGPPNATLGWSRNILPKRDPRSTHFVRCIPHPFRLIFGASFCSNYPHFAIGAATLSSIFFLLLKIDYFFFAVRQP